MPAVVKIFTPLTSRNAALPNFSASRPIASSQPPARFHCALRSCGMPPIVSGMGSDCQTCPVSGSADAAWACGSAAPAC